jgi:hypothetical protein
MVALLDLGFTPRRPRKLSQTPRDHPAQQLRQNASMPDNPENSAEVPDQSLSVDSNGPRSEADGGQANTLA